MAFQPFHDLPGISPLDEDSYTVSTFDATYDPTWNLNGATPRIYNYNASSDQPWTTQRFFEQKPFYSGELPTFPGSHFGRPYPDNMSGIYEAPDPYPDPVIQAKSPGLSSNSSITDLDSDGSVNGTDLSDSRHSSGDWRHPLLSSAGGPQKEGLLRHTGWATQHYNIVTPRELQCYPDEVDEASCNDDDSMDFKSQQQYYQETPDSIAVGIADCRDPPEGFSTSVQAGFVGTSGADAAEDDEADPSYSPVQKGRSSRPRREPQSKRSSPSQASDKADGILRKNSKTSKVIKSGKYGSRCDQHPKKTFRNASEYRKHMQTQHTRPFLCTFYFAECDQQFGSKNEWKRHVHSQHLQLGYWQCDYKSCVERSGSNLFNRKDLFTQHLRRMHLDKKLTKEAEQRELPVIWNRCYKVRREAPTSSTCGYCGKKFQGRGSWDARMEHVGHHYENPRQLANPTDWKEDQELIQWMLREGLIRPKDSESKADAEQQERPAQWNSPARSAYTVWGLGTRPSRRRSSEDGNSSDAETRSRQWTSAVKAEPATDDDADGDDE